MKNTNNIYKLSIAIIFLASLLTGLILFFDFYFGYFRYNELRLIDWIVIISGILSTLTSIYGIIRLVINEKNKGEITFELQTLVDKRQKLLLILLVIITLTEFILSMIIPSIILFIVGLMLGSQTLSRIVHQSVKQGITDSGIIISGVNLKFKSIASYRWSEDNEFIEFKTKGSLLGMEFNNKFKYTFNNEDKKEIDGFLNRHLKKS